MHVQLASDFSNRDALRVERGNLLVSFQPALVPLISCGLHFRRLLGNRRLCGARFSGDIRHELCHILQFLAMSVHELHQRFLQIVQ
jgi:hypothetical protein